MRQSTPIWWRLSAAERPAMPPPTMITCMRFPATPTSVRRDARIANDRPVARVVGRDQVPKIFASGETEIVAERRQPFLQVRELRDLADLLAETLDDIAWRLGRSRDGEPDTDIEAGERALRNGRHLRENGDALRGRGCQGLHLTGLDELNDGVGRRPDQWDLPAEEIVERGRRAAIRHMGDIDLGGTVEHGGGEMVRRADARRSDRELAG